ncbi:MAG: hypothetical protein HY736_18090 [Verrucomicrobia bacterium]|nr:hypothetical protein [Verrucomicrobiota bacterium]
MSGGAEEKRSTLNAQPPTRGERGSALLEDDHLSHWEIRDALPGDEKIRSARIDAAMRFGAGAPNAFSYLGHQLQMQDLVDSLRENRGVAVDGYEAREAVALIRALCASAERVVPVKLAA